MRWHLVARGLGVGVDVAPAVASYYRSQFLNTTLPAGIVGDVHRGLRHGRAAGDTGLGLRSVAWERVAGQLVQVVISAVVLLLLPSPVHISAPALLGVVVAVFLAAVVLRKGLPTEGTSSPTREVRGITRAPSTHLAALATARKTSSLPSRRRLAMHALGTRLILRTSREGHSRVTRVLRAAREDLRRGVLSRRAWPGVVLASTVALAGHVATYAVAARAVGVTASPAQLLPLVLLVLLAMAVPLNIAGWGPREGMAAWAFAAAGLGAAEGVATAVAYGAMVTVASLPGAVVLLVASVRRRAPRPALASPVLARMAREGVVSHG